MRLYLLRHAIAAARDPRRYPGDVDRPLTQLGRERMREAARGMKSLSLRFSLVLTSPLARAKETARIVAREMALPSRPKLHRPLAPGGTITAILSGIPENSGARDVLLVGHEPDLSRLAARLTGAAEEGSLIVMKKGGLCRIDFDGRPEAGAGRLAFLLTPRVLRRLAQRR